MHVPGVMSSILKPLLPLSVLLRCHLDKGSLAAVTLLDLAAIAQTDQFGAKVCGALYWRTIK